MNVSYDKLGDVTAEITVTLEEKDYADKIKAQLKEIAKTRQEPGFRPGHVPASLIEKKYGQAVKYDVINKEVSEALYDYVKEHELPVLGNPVPEKSEEFDLTAKGYTFKFKLGLAPEVKVKVDKSMTIPYYTIEVSDEMIDRQDEMLRRRNGAQVPGEEVEPDALVKGVITELNEDGSVKEGGVMVENGIVAPKYFKDEDQRKIFEGKKVGDKLVFNPAATCEANPNELSSMLNIDKKDTDLYKGDFSFDIKEIIVLRPAELNQEYFDAVFGKDQVHDEKEYREALKNMIARQLVADSNYRFTIDAKDTIMKAEGEMVLPEEILVDYLMMQNRELDEAKAKEEFGKARADLEWQIVRDGVARQFELKLEEADLLNVAKLIAQNQFAQYGMTNIPEESLEKYAKEMLGDAKTRERIANQALDMKLFASIKDAVTVDDKTVSVDDFNALFKTEEE